MGGGFDFVRKALDIGFGGAFGLFGFGGGGGRLRAGVVPVYEVAAAVEFRVMAAYAPYRAAVEAFGPAYPRTVLGGDEVEVARDAVASGLFEHHEERTHPVREFRAARTAVLEELRRAHAWSAMRLLDGLVGVVDEQKRTFRAVDPPPLQDAV